MHTAAQAICTILQEHASAVIMGIIISLFSYSITLILAIFTEIIHTASSFRAHIVFSTYSFANSMQTRC